MNSENGFLNKLKYKVSDVSKIKETKSLKSLLAKFSCFDIASALKDTKCNSAEIKTFNDTSTTVVKKLPSILSSFYYSLGIDSHTAINKESVLSKIKTMLQNKESCDKLVVFITIFNQLAEVTNEKDCNSDIKFTKITPPSHCPLTGIFEQGSWVAANYESISTNFAKFSLFKDQIQKIMTTLPINWK